MPKARKNSTKPNGTATIGYEAELWRMADALRGSMDAAEYKHVVLGLIFLKYISDAFEEQHARLEAERAQGADPGDPVECQDVPGLCKSATRDFQALKSVLEQLLRTVEKRGP